VFVARHRELGTLVAVKRLSAGRDQAADVARFRREATLAAQLKSKHIVRVFDFGVDDAGPYMVMELLEGEDLAARIERESRLPEREVVLIADQVARALGCAHEAGLLHRDVKPANIFLAKEDGIVVKVLDFGIAKPLKSQDGNTTVTVDGAMVGSPAYMSPEQVWGQVLDARSDVWALTAVTYQMLFGRGPFSAEHPGDLLARVCAGNFVRPSQLDPASAHWDAFFERGFLVNREGRHESIAAFRNALARVIGIEPPCSETGVDTTTQKLFRALGVRGSVNPQDNGEAIRARRFFQAGMVALGLGGSLAAWSLFARNPTSHISARSLSRPEREHLAQPEANNPSTDPAPPPQVARREDAVTNGSNLPLAPIPSLDLKPGEVLRERPRAGKALRTAPSGTREKSNPSKGDDTADPASQRRDPFTGLIEDP
jgi:serine/threonine protein kinase